MDLSAVRYYISIIEETWVYTTAIAFYGLYPILTSLVYIVTAGVYYFRRPPRPVQYLSDKELPFVSVIIPAFCEEDVIGHSIRGVLKMDYPKFEVIVVNDGSTDRTADVVRSFLNDKRVRLLDKKVNEGKAMALNDAVLCAQAELLLVMDADAVPDRKLLRAMVPHFRWGRVAAVAGNPRVRNTGNLLCRLQAIEFSSVIGLMRRAQRIWGRVMCVSGVVGMFRKSAIVDAGLFSPGMATEDIDLTWKLQTKFYDIRYEPSALVWMIVPETVGVWWKQRRRWALGLGQVLRRYAVVFTDWRWRRMHPLYIESALSYVWALTFIVITGFWILSYAVGHPPRGGSPIPNFWGMLLYTFCLVQLACGTWMDSKHDPDIARHYPVSIIYPTFYWFLLTITSAVYTTKGLLKRIELTTPMRWHIHHSYDQKP
jgi:biofilm PGA synthesis N-glycosyltransferase PgaC